MTTNKTDAVVLRRTNYGEADRILQILTPFGKVSVIARGVRREKSRLAGGIELFSICEVSFTDGRGELGVLTSARLKYFFNYIMQDYDRMQFAYLIIKLVNSASDSNDGSEWYDLLVETLAGLNSRTVNFNLIETWFYVKYSTLTGYELSLWNDCDGKKIIEGASYRYDETERCFRRVVDGEFNSDHIKLLRLVESKPLKSLALIGGIEKIIINCSIVARQHASV